MAGKVWTSGGKLFTDDGGDNRQLVDLTRLDFVDEIVVHDFERDGWGRFTGVQVSEDGAQTHTLSVENQRGRITANSGSEGSYRKWWLHRDTGGWEDSEITSLWFAGSSFTSPNTPQFMHVHRAQQQADGTWRSFVVSCNIFASTPERINKNNWTTDETTLTLGSNGNAFQPTAWIDKQLRIFGVNRFQFGDWFNEYACIPTHLNGLAIGDTVTIDVEGDDTFDETSIAIANADPKAGGVQVVEDTTLSAVSYVARKGTITQPNHQRFWPYWVKSWLEGQKLWVKTWRLNDPEPPDSDTNRTDVYDASGDQTPEPNTTAPVGQGFCGIGGAHLAESGWLEYGSPVTFRRR